MEQYENREKYWTVATTCFGAVEKRVDEAAEAKAAEVRPTANPTASPTALTLPLPRWATRSSRGASVP